MCHAVTDAVLGAAALGDIGRHFPDTDPQWKGADSVKLLAHAVSLVRAAGWTVANVDVVVIARAAEAGAVRRRRCARTWRRRCSAAWSR